MHTPELPLRSVLGKGYSSWDTYNNYEALPQLVSTGDGGLWPGLVHNPMVAFLSTYILYGHHGLA